MGTKLVARTDCKKDDVRLTSFNYESIDIESINPGDREVLVTMYYTVNKSVAHLTSVKGDERVFQCRKNLAIILNLLDKYLYQKHGDKFPVDIKEFVDNDRYYWSYQCHMDRINKPNGSG